MRYTTSPTPTIHNTDNVFDLEQRHFTQVFEKLRSWERVQSIRLFLEPFSVSNGLLTQTLKVCSIYLSACLSICLSVCLSVPPLPLPFLTPFIFTFPSSDKETRDIGVAQGYHRQNVLASEATV